MSKILNLFSILAFLVALLGSAVTYTPVHAASTLFVKMFATGSGSCYSWTHACVLQEALAVASAGDQVWVQAGTYRPHFSASERGISFTLKNGVALYGGFAGTETQLNQRNPTANVTILSGDLNGDDNGLMNHGENSYHVVVSSNTDSSTILDGFTIYGGNANGPSYPDEQTGGGMHNSGGSPTLNNVIFSGNSAEWDGGGIHNNSDPTLMNVTFTGNSTTGDGAGMYNASGNPSLTNVTFSGNSAGGWGGGMYNSGGSSTLTNVTFSGNSAGSGGGMFSHQGSPKLTNVTFSENSAIESGGGMVSSASYSTLANVTFSGNSANLNGGGLLTGGGSLTLTNTIIANSPSGGDCVNVSGALNAASSNNLIEGPFDVCGLTNGANGNITGVDPKLGPLGNNGGFTETHALLAGSPAINTGTNTNCPATDQRGVTRPQGSQCDIGAYEFPYLTITGNAGAAGVMLSYTDGSAKTATSFPNGSYSFTIPKGWSGTVTPSHICFTFTPASRSYNNVTANLTTQNYSPTFKPASNCAQVTVKLGPSAQGPYVIAKNAGARLPYPNVNTGPVTVSGSTSVRFVASERVAYTPDGGKTWKHFSEMMGLPDTLKSTKYAFPAYDNSAFDSELRFANVGTVSTQVTVTLSGVAVPGSPYTLAAGQSLLKSFTSLNGGPLVLQSSGGVPIVASLRVLTKPYTGSYSEVMGTPGSQLSSSYLFPWYNNVELNTQLRVANVGASTTTVTVTIPGQPAKTFTLARNGSTRVSYPGWNAGPLKVTSSGGVPIVASLRVLFPQTGTPYTSFSEMMGFPASQVTSGYVFPWYNNKDLNTQLRVANIDITSTNVHVYIGGQEVAGSPFPLAPGQSLRKFFDVDRGPVVVRSEGGKKILASLRILFPKSGTPFTSFSELMGIPENKLDTKYYFPWYNNVNFNSQLRLGVP